MAPGRATWTVMLAMAVLLLSSFVTCTDVSDDVMQTASGFAQNAKETSETWVEWAQDKIAGGFGFRQDDGKGAPPADGHHMAEKSKIEFDNPLSAAAFDASQKVEDAKDAVEAKVGGLSAAMSQSTGHVTDLYEEAKARLDSFDRKKEEEIERSKP